MPEGVFITGGSGSSAIDCWKLRRRWAGRCLRLERRARRASSETSDVSIVSGDLLRPESYRDVLPSCDTVMHLAAATGRASAGDHERVNARGTEILLEECRRAGVAKVLFVSSVATTFPDKTGYPYALTKARAEEAVRARACAS